ncbi:MAG: hypothetical protein HDR77_04640 [Bacteroides sp.]|nr:hypothetical protein [Bacteroides sp.]
MIQRFHAFMSSASGETAEVTAALYPGPGRRELHAVIVPAASRHFLGQLDGITGALAELRAAHPGMEIAYSRFYISDPVNRLPELRAAAPFPAFSVAGQPPLGGERLALLVILIETPNVSSDSGIITVSRGHYTDCWLTTRAPESGTSSSATTQLLTDLDTTLSSILNSQFSILNSHSPIKDTTLRTWFFVRDIDATYSGLVSARNHYFARIGLTPSTHFIASTGIGAQGLTQYSPLSFEAYSVLGIDPDQIAYLRAPSHLNDTISYGVAFERATAVTYGDRRQIIVSGTASIDAQGQIHAPGLIRAQMTRMADNVDILLAQGAARPTDIMHIVLYVRDLADAPIARDMIAERYPGVPTIAVLAPVCRPGWLVEMECIAMYPLTTPAPYPAY